MVIGSPSYVRFLLGDTKWPATVVVARMETTSNGGTVAFGTSKLTITT